MATSLIPVVAVGVTVSVTAAQVLKALPPQTKKSR
jgi:hypothetical protein